MQSNNEKKECNLEKKICCNKGDWQGHPPVEYRDYFYCTECREYCACQPQNEEEHFKLEKEVEKISQAYLIEFGNGFKLWHEYGWWIQEINKLVYDLKNQKLKKQYGNEEIQKMFEKLIPKLQDAGIHGFSDSQKWARIYAKHLVNLQKKLGEEEFDRRVDVLLSNSFYRQNCNKIKYLYNNINGFVEPKSNISTLVL